MKNIFIYFLCIGFFIQAQNTKDFSYMKNANKKYASKDYKNAEIEYNKVLEKKNTYEANFNKANTQLQQKKIDDAVKTYQISINKTKNNIQKSKAHYNIGNALMEKQNYEKAVDYYKNAIKLNPTDTQAKENFVIAKKKQKQQEEEQKNQEKSKEKGGKAPKDGENGKNKDDQENSNSEKDNKPKNKNIQNQKNQQNTNPNDVNENEYQRILEAMNEQEQNTQKKVITNKTKNQEGFKEKNW